MIALYIFLAIVWGGPVALAVGVAWKIVTYSRKQVHYINEYGNPRTKWVDDTDYHYKPEELWEAPPYWKAALEQAQKDWKPKENA